MAEDDDHPEGDVGYRRPPEEHRIKPGEKRNPWGRKGKPRPKPDFMDELIKIQLDGKVQKVTRENAIDYALFQEAVKGNVSAAKEAARRRKERDRVANDNTADTLLSAEDAALERLIKRQVEQRTASDKPNQAGPGDKPNRFKTAANKFVPGGKK